MALPLLRALALLLLALQAPAGAAASPQTEAAARAGAAATERSARGVLAAGTPAETTWRAIEGPRPGPTVLLVGGVHGNEPAGARAARQISSWPVVRGRLVVVERANVQALAAGERFTPGLPKARRDLNRQFPAAPDADALPRDLWDLVQGERPALVIDLHEGYDFCRENPDSVGSSVIASPAARDHARAMVLAIDRTIRRPERRFMVKGPPIRGSLARAAADELGIPALIVETTTRAQSLAFRTRQHRILVREALERVGLLEPGPDLIVGPGVPAGVRRVAMYASTGVGGPGPARLEELLVEEHGFLLRRVCATDVRAGLLEQFDAVIFPGGSASRQAKALGEDGRARVRAFVEAGGGYVGICAGAYLAALNYDWSLGVLDANVIDRAHWRRGRARVPLRWTEAARLLDPPGAAASDVLYANGPILEPADHPEAGDLRVLAAYDGEVAANGAPRGVMPGTPAIVAGRFGAGRVVCSSPHPEQTEGLEAVARGLVRIAVGGEPARR